MAGSGKMIIQTNDLDASNLSSSTNAVIDILGGTYEQIGGSLTTSSDVYGINISAGTGYFRDFRVDARNSITRNPLIKIWLKLVSSILCYI